MGGFFTAAVGLGLAAYQGEQQKKAANEQAEDTRLVAEAEVDRINQELDEALSMQDVLFGGQGRVVEGSAAAVKTSDTAAAERDKTAVRAGAERVGSAQRQAGRVAKFGTVSSGILKAGNTANQYSQVK